MLDPKYFRQDLAITAELLAQRGVKLDTSLIQSLEDERRTLQISVQKLQNERNQLSREIGRAKAQGTDTTQSLHQVSELGSQLSTQEQRLNWVLDQLQEIYLQTPNLPHSTVPQGTSEADNLELRRWGTPREFTFDPQDHVALGEQLGMMDFAAAAKITGARFVVLSDKLARLQRALIQFMLDIHTNQHGYQELYLPHLVNEASLLGTAQLPKFGNDLFQITDETRYRLIPTAEVPITNLIRDEILAEKSLPRKYVAHTPCYRSEAGSYGKDLRGMIRQHQFEKIELVRIERPQDSYTAHEELTGEAEKILQLLELPYRVISLCTGDLGFASAKTHDLEVWIPSQQCYREISSCSNFESFQARRMLARYRTEAGTTELVHTLNGSGLAVGRTLVALLENYQNQDGSIRIPEVLVKYFDGNSLIKR